MIDYEEKLKALSIRLYFRILHCSCKLVTECERCYRDLDALREAGCFGYLSDIDSSFLKEMARIEKTKRK